MKKLILTVLMSTLLVACGGEKTLTGQASSSSSSSSSSAPVPAAATVTLSLSSPQLQSEGSIPVNITATVKDINNVVISGTTVNFSVTSGSLTVIQPVTDKSGLATATLARGSDPSNRAITITATSGTISTTSVINVVGTTLNITGAPSLVLGNSSAYTVTLLDSSAKAIANTAVTVTSANSNPLSAPTLTTDAQGKATIILTANAAGTDTLTAKALGLTAIQPISISGQNFQFTTPIANVKIAVGAAPTPVTITWANSGTPVPNGTPINFAATRGTLSAGNAVTTGGQATVNISSNNAGPAVISATGNGVSAQLSISFVATKPDAIAIQANPATVATQAQSTITATVRDATGNLVEGQQVDFSISSGGGTLSLASSQTNQQGQAQTVFTASTTPSGSNGVTIVASFPTTGLGYVPTTSSVSTQLTVGGQAVFLSLGTGNKIGENGTQTLFIEPWVVQAVDSAGNAVPNVNITLTIHSTRYRKGFWSPGPQFWIQNITATCMNEDINLNGQLDPADSDLNGNGKLEPGDIAVSAPGSVTTGTDGSVSFNVNYPEDHALWVESKLTASTVVSGTESSTSQTFFLPILATYVNDLKSSPPGANSPYGQSTLCTDTL